MHSSTNQMKFVIFTLFILSNVHHFDSVQSAGPIDVTSSDDLEVVKNATTLEVEKLAGGDVESVEKVVKKVEANSTTEDKTDDETNPTSTEKETVVEPTTTGNEGGEDTENTFKALVQINRFELDDNISFDSDKDDKETLKGDMKEHDGLSDSKTHGKVVGVSKPKGTGMISIPISIEESRFYRLSFDMKINGYENHEDTEEADKRRKVVSNLDVNVIGKPKTKKDEEEVNVKSLTLFKVDDHRTYFEDQDKWISLSLMFRGKEVLEAIGIEDNKEHEIAVVFEGIAGEKEGDFVYLDNIMKKSIKELEAAVQEKEERDSKENTTKTPETTSEGDNTTESTDQPTTKGTDEPTTSTEPTNTTTTTTTTEKPDDDGQNKKYTITVTLMAIVILILFATLIFITVKYLKLKDAASATYDMTPAAQANQQYASSRINDPPAPASYDNPMYNNNGRM